jgi:alkanesulfonate monooxygenase SsuD/methylene tetrahydromethanopterin reductase-like flavin-dependent oxidoreductase (luciferase family)
VAGPHPASPSPQRTPLLFQAAVTEADRETAARNAEAVFIHSPGLAEAARRDGVSRARYG